MKYWYSYKLFYLKKTNRLDFNSMRQLGIPKKIIGRVILDEVINDFRLKEILQAIATNITNPKIINASLINVIFFGNQFNNN